MTPDLANVPPWSTDPAVVYVREVERGVQRSKVLRILVVIAALAVVVVTIAFLASAEAAVGNAQRGVTSATRAVADAESALAAAKSAYAAEKANIASADDPGLTGVALYFQTSGDATTLTNSSQARDLADAKIDLALAKVDPSIARKTLSRANASATVSILILVAALVLVAIAVFAMRAVVRRAELKLGNGLRAYQTESNN